MKLRDDTIAQGMPLAIQRSISQRTLQQLAACGAAVECSRVPVRRCFHVLYYSEHMTHKTHCTLY